MLESIIVIAKTPIAGRVKTRLCPPFSPEQAAILADAAICDTLEVGSAIAARRRLLVLEGPPWAGVRADWTIVSQVSGGLDQRLVAAFAVAGSGPALLVGMDTPQITATQLLMFAPDRFDACLGPARDGGYWAIGFRDPQRHADVISGIAMSTSSTGAAQLLAMRRRGLRIQTLDELTDVDTYSDARTVAELHPKTRFAAAFRTLSLRQAS